MRRLPVAPQHRRARIVTGVAAALLAVIPALGGIAACRAPTEITLELSTDAKCVDVKGTAITVGDLTNLDVKPSTTVTPACDPRTGRIGSMVIVPSGSKDDTVAIKVVLGVGRDPAECVPPAYGPGCVVARRALHFIAGSSLTVPVFMALSCTGLPCGATETCVAGNCRPATITDPTLCESPTGCDEGSLVLPPTPAPDRDSGAGPTGPTPSCACGLSPPDASWSLVAYAPTRAAACPAGFDSADVLADPSAPAGACTCGTCAVTSAPTSCTTGTVSAKDDSGGMLGVCNTQSPVTHPGNGGACTQHLGTLAQHLQAEPPLPVGGACSAAGVANPSLVASQTARTCAPSGGACACDPSLPADFSVCLGSAGDVACPATAPKKHLVGAAPTVACAACPCKVACSGKLAFYSDGACASLIASIGSTTCAVGGGSSYASYKWSGAADCLADSSPPPGPASFTDARTVCCQ